MMYRASGVYPCHDGFQVYEVCLSDARPMSSGGYGVCHWGTFLGDNPIIMKIERGYSRYVQTKLLYRPPFVLVLEPLLLKGAWIARLVVAVILICDTRGACPRSPEGDIFSFGRRMLEVG